MAAMIVGMAMLTFQNRPALLNGSFLALPKRGYGGDGCEREVLGIDIEVTPARAGTDVMPSINGRNKHFCSAMADGRIR